MTSFTTLSTAMQDKLKTLVLMNGVGLVQEDAEDIETEINKATDEIGMMVLLGIPNFDNQSPLTDVVNAVLKVEILVREVPAIWRLASNQNPVHCSDLGQAIAPALQGLTIDGFQPLRVIRGESTGNFAQKQRDTGEPKIFQDYIIEIETMQIFDAS